jgi:hypothetical protein
MHHISAIWSMFEGSQNCIRYHPITNPLWAARRCWRWTVLKANVAAGIVVNFLGDMRHPFEANLVAQVPALTASESKWSPCRKRSAITFMRHWNLGFFDTSKAKLAIICRASSTSLLAISLAFQLSSSQMVELFAFITLRTSIARHVRRSPDKNTHPPTHTHTRIYINIFM